MRQWWPPGHGFTLYWLTADYDKWVEAYSLFFFPVYQSWHTTAHSEGGIVAPGAHGKHTAPSNNSRGCATFEQFGAPDPNVPSSSQREYPSAGSRPRGQSPTPFAFILLFLPLYFFTLRRVSTALRYEPPPPCGNSRVLDPQHATSRMEARN